jgi:hypothetical protein
LNTEGDALVAKTGVETTVTRALAWELALYNCTGADWLVGCGRVAK